MVGVFTAMGRGVSRLACTAAALGSLLALTAWAWLALPAALLAANFG